MTQQESTQSDSTDEFTLDDLPQPEFDGTRPADSLEVDGQNPNEMDDDAFTLLAEKMEERGWVGGPIVTDTSGLIADGEHRWRAARELGLDEVPVREYDLSDGERRLLRQELNKIRGSHDIDADADEYERILDGSSSADSVAELAESLATDSGDIQNTIDQFGSDDTDIDDIADSALGDDGIPDEFPDVDGQDTDHECPNCGYEW